MTRILFVCLGNICRSPAAEAVFSAAAQAAGVPVTVDSAGTAGWHRGKPPHPPIIAAAAARGLDMRPLRARQFTVQDFTDFDLIIGMDESNLRDINALRPVGCETPLRPMMSYAPHNPLREVPDPYYTGDFEQTLDLLEEAAHGLLATLR